MALKIFQRHTDGAVDFLLATAALLDVARTSFNNLVPNEQTKERTNKKKTSAEKEKKKKKKKI